MAEIGADEQRVLERLQASSVGMSSRDLARSTKLRPTEVNSVLLKLQRINLVNRNGTRWVATSARRGSASNIGAAEQSPAGASATRRPKTAYGSSLPTTNTEFGSSVNDSEDTTERVSRRIDRAKSRWSVFRNLCEYYAECVRLDQRSTIHAKAEDELDTIVCLDGRLPDDAELRIRTRSTWNEWIRKSTTVDYLFLGYPLQRYLWKDSSNDEKVTFISPVLMVPCRFRLEGTNLILERVGSIRINEGWLERRLKNIEARKAFLDIVGVTSTDATELEPSERSWSEYASLLNHYYHDWCFESLDPTHVVSEPPLADLQKDGLYNRAGIFIPRKWRYTSGLHQELLSLANDVADEALDKSALRSCFPHKCHESAKNVQSNERNDDPPGLVGASPLPLNHEQQNAVDISATASLSVIVGPPGTGKSRVVAAVLAHQALQGRNALFASRNHQALEAVVPRVNALTEPWPFMLRLSRPWGAAIDESMTAAIAQLVGSDRECDQRRISQLTTSLQRRLREYRDASRVVDELLVVRQEVTDTAFAHEEDLRNIDPRFQGNFRHSYRIADAATIDRINEKLVRPSQFQPRLSWINAWIRFKLKWKHALQQARAVDQSFRQSFDPQSKLPITPSTDSIQFVDYFHKCLDFWRPFSVANASLERHENRRQKLEQFPDVDEACRLSFLASQEASRHSSQLCKELAIQTGAGITNEERRQLAEILASIENRSGLDSEEDRTRWEKAMRKSFPTFLRHYPLIATTNLSVRRDLSLEPASFDLLIVDEASQCDIASVIPLLFRSKRAMIVGDPMQLSHVTSLSSATDRHLKRQFSVDATELERFSYRTTSMFHLANTSEAVDSRISLRQHHRCHPSIADYCNQSFYRGTWIVLTEGAKQRGLIWTHATDDSRPAAGGGATSQGQIEMILEELRRLNANEFVGSIGVVTPFRKQADRLRDQIFQEFPKSTLDHWQMLVNTADGFQGDERDLVLLSLVAGDNLTEGSMGFLAGGPNRFNVAVSRAKQLLHVFGDADWARGCKIGHIRNLVEACDRELATPQEYDPTSFRRDLVGPVWEPALANALEAAGLPYFQQFPAQGRFLDFALFCQNLKLNVEVDGEAYHRSATGGNVEEDMRRDQALVAAGWKILRFWVYQLREDMGGCVERVKSAFNSDPDEAASS